MSDRKRVKYPNPLFVAGANIEILRNSLARMLEVYWGEGDGQLPEPLVIQEAKEALVRTYGYAPTEAK